MNNILKYQKLTLWWALFVLMLCNINMGSVGHSHLFFAGFDKLVHCGLFFLFTLFYTYGIIKQQHNFTWLTAVKAFATAVIYGALIEILQLYIFTWRSGEWNDLFADSVGAGMAAFSTLLITSATKKERD